MSPIGKASGAAAPVLFERVWIVDQAGAAGIIRYTSIQEVIALIEALPSGEKPSELTPHVIIVHPGQYTGKIWLPDFVWLVGTSAISCSLVGDSIVDAGDVMISVGMGGVENFLVSPAGSNGNPGAGIYSRNSTSVFTVDEDDFGTLSDDTLKVTPNGQSQEVINFVGGESTAQEVADEINNQAVNFEALVRFGRVEIRKISLTNDGVTMDSTGTANAALGFSTTVDTSNPTSSTEHMILQNVFTSFGGGRSFDDTILMTDRGGGQYNYQNITVLGGLNAGVHLEENVDVLAFSIFCFLNGTGILMDAQTLFTISGGFSNFNTVDLDLDNTAVLRCQNFAYEKRAGRSGKIIPSGSRVDFEFNIAGAIMTGRQDGIRPLQFGMTIESISMSRETPGIGGTTTIDIKKGGGGGGVGSATLYPSNPGNRFIFPNTDGTDRVKDTPLSFPLPDTINLNQGEYLHLDVLTVETGNPKGLHVKITAVVNA